VAVALVAITAVAIGSVVAADGGLFLGADATSSGSASPVRCRITPDASPSATIVLIHQEYGDPVTVGAGEAVAFSNQTNTTHTITEGTFGTALPAACVDNTLRKSRELTVTFGVPGDYPFTCRRHPSMHTTVHVREAASPSPAGAGSR
jgi:hypothetical protein